MQADENSHSRDVLVLLLVVLVVGVVGFALDRLLLREGVHRVDIMALSNGLTGIAAGLLYLQVTRVERERRAATQERLRTIAEMNHHIRNALQVITYAGATHDTESVELIRSSVERIEWALREVLPGHVTEESNVNSGAPDRESTPAS